MSKLAKTIVTPKERIVRLNVAAPNEWAVSYGGTVRGYVTGIGNGDGTRAHKWAITGSEKMHHTRGAALDALLDSVY